MPRDGDEKGRECLKDYSDDSFSESQVSKDVRSEGKTVEARREDLKRILSDYRNNRIPRLPANLPTVLTAKAGVKSYGPNVQFFINGFLFGKDKRPTLPDLRAIR